MLGFIRRNLKINSKSIKAQAYTMLARPKLEYASPVWDPHKIEQINDIERVQRRAARIVTNDTETPVVSEKCLLTLTGKHWKGVGKMPDWSYCTKCLRGKFASAARN